MIINGKNYDLEKLAEIISQKELNLEDNPQLLSLFNFFDTSRDGKLDKKELREAFSIFSQMDCCKSESDAKGILSEEELQQGVMKFEGLDVTKDGLVDFIEKLFKSNTNNIAQELYDQISGPSFNFKTRNKLSKINKDNVVDILNAYKNLDSNKKRETLVKAIDAEWRMGIEDVKNFICEPLAQKALEYGFDFEYKEYENLDELEMLIDVMLEQLEFVSHNSGTSVTTSVSEENGVKSVLKVRKNEVGQICQDTLLEMDKTQDSIISVKYYNKLYTRRGSYKENVVEYKYSKQQMEDYILNNAYANDGKKITYFDDIPAIRELEESERTDEQIELLEEFENMLEFAIEAGLDYGVDPNLVLAIIQKEVDFQGLRKSASGSLGKGYMQVTSAPINDFLGLVSKSKYSSRKIGNYGWEMAELLASRGFDSESAKTDKQKKKLYQEVFNYLHENNDPEFNIRMGTLILRYELNKNNGNVKNAAKTYNASSVAEKYSDLVQKYYELLIGDFSNPSYKIKVKK